MQYDMVCTCAVVSPVLQPLQPVDEVVDDLLPRLGGQVVEVSEDPAHLGGVALVVDHALLLQPGERATMKLVVILLVGGADFLFLAATGRG